MRMTFDREADDLVNVYSHQTQLLTLFNPTTRPSMKADTQ